jgi:murein DD-endopeptidase MepM/ murein hydrolase activator NlpD
MHNGIDMFAPTGAPEAAVGPGRVTYQVETAGGNAAYLWADDGNVYYYAHMSAFVGTNDRRVARGETIGSLGQTGNATAPHLHFEIRLGGANGTRIDPYPTLSAAGC